MSEGMFCLLLMAICVAERIAAVAIINRLDRPVSGIVLYAKMFDNLYGIGYICLYSVGHEDTYYTFFAESFDKQSSSYC